VKNDKKEEGLKELDEALLLDTDNFLSENNVGISVIMRNLFQRLILNGNENS
jgi:hypothetical protein